MDFILGCNYWASNAGTDMWRDFDIDIIRKDIKTLSEYGVAHLRVFPNWRDFQPVFPMIKGGGIVFDYCLENDNEPTNPYYLDDKMMEEFSIFLDICQEYDIKVIVGLITGWMSGRLFVPPVLFGKNVLADPLALHFEQLFIKGFVSHFKDRHTIIAWDLGNECNCMGSADKIQSENWTSIISNAIRAEDSSREIVSGMHGLSVEKTNPWSIAEQSFYTDILTTHPYPYWCQHTRIDKTLSLRTTMHATAETKLYSEIGNKPCLAEEIGTMGPMVCSEEKSGNFLRVNLFSLWANNSAGVMWWCAHDQTMLDSFPYTENMVEVELGMLDKNHNPKPVLKEMKKFNEFLKTVDFKLPPAQTDAVCLLTDHQRQWGIGYMTHILLKQIGMNCKFAYSRNELPESNLYILPSINGVTVMNKKTYTQLKDKVYNGATVYISVDTGVLSEFEEFAGLKIIDSCEHFENNSLMLDGEKITFTRNRKLILEESGAKILAYDNDNNPAISVNKYGKGNVIFINFPLENNLIDTPDAFSSNNDLIYSSLFQDFIKKSPVKIKNKNVVSTYHKTDDGIIVVMINHTDKGQNPDIEVDKNYNLEKIYYGNIDNINAFDACVLKYRK